MRVGAAAKTLGTTADTLRFYEKRGLIRLERRDNGYRDVSEATLGLLRLIRLAQELGFSLREIAELTSALGDGEMSASDVGALLQRKIDEIDARMRDMASLRALLVARQDAACPLGLDLTG